MQFIADVMLGRLAKRMRLLGIDVRYERAIDDNEILRIALAEDRVILTRDHGLAARPLAARHVLIVHDDVEQQLEQVFSALPGARDSSPLTRCSCCNELLVPLPREEARDLVPGFVYDHSDLFLFCPHCDKVYWEGTHVVRWEEGAKKKAGPL